jgi:putative N6-adenine-specific DNA methylase
LNSLETSRFFVSAAIGMEAEVLQEIREVWGELLDLDGRPHSFELSDVQVEKGGVSLTAPLHLGLQLNFFLKTPHRILLRLKEFRCRDFPKLFSEAQKILLKEYLPKASWGLEVAASKSRLNHEGRIRETLEKAWGIKPDSAASADIYVRFFDDLCSISLDTTGRHLHFRGNDLHKGEAPLRETLAAFCIRAMTSGLGAQEISQISWVDPMMGSGTFLLELAELFQPQKFREFSFQQWKKTPKAMKSAAWLHNYPAKAKLHWKIFGADRDPEMVSIARRNLSQRGISALHLEQRDVFAGRSADTTAGTESPWLILNSPYGERIAAEFSPTELLVALQKDWRPEKIGILFSKRQAGAAPRKVQNLVWTHSVALSNGGLPCEFMIWQKDLSLSGGSLDTRSR